MKIGLVIPVYQGADFLSGLLESLFTHFDDQIKALWVIDNGSTDGADLVFHHWHPDFRALGVETTLIRNEENRGFGPAVNQGLERGLANPDLEALCVSNVDTLVQENWLYWLVTALKEDRKIGMASSHITETMTPDEFRLFDFGDTEIGNQLVMRYHEKGNPWLFRRAALEEVGLFDEQFQYAQYEDSDLLLRLAIDKWHFVKVENSRTYHYVGSRGQQSARLVVGYDFAAENRQRYYEKWKNIIPEPQIWNPFIDNRE